MNNITKLREIKDQLFYHENLSDLELDIITMELELISGIQGDHTSASEFKVYEECYDMLDVAEKHRAAIEAEEAREAELDERRYESAKR